MFAVGVLDTSPGAEERADALSARIGGGITALDVRMALAGVLPRVILRTPLRERAEDAASALVCAGVPAIAVDMAAVTPVERMVHVRRFALEPDCIKADARGPVLAYDRIAAIARVATDTAVQRTTREHEFESAHGRQTQYEVEITRTEHAHEQALFLFVADAAPWVVRAGEARYLGLGPLMKRTQIENLLTLAAVLRERAPRAAYDERFVANPIAPTGEARVRDHDAPTLTMDDASIDLRVHLLGQVLAGHHARGAYR
jgi:hypothetical protein